MTPHLFVFALLQFEPQPEVDVDFSTTDVLDTTTTFFPGKADARRDGFMQVSATKDRSIGTRRLKMYVLTRFDRKHTPRQDDVFVGGAG